MVGVGVVGRNGVSRGVHARGGVKCTATKQETGMYMYAPLQSRRERRVETIHETQPTIGAPMAASQQCVGTISNHQGHAFISHGLRHAGGRRCAASVCVYETGLSFPQRPLITSRPATANVFCSLFVDALATQSRQWCARIQMRREQGKHKRGIRRSLLGWLIWSGAVCFICSPSINMNLSLLLHKLHLLQKHPLNTPHVLLVSEQCTHNGSTGREPCVRVRAVQPCRRNNGGTT